MNKSFSQAYKENIPSFQIWTRKNLPLTPSFYELPFGHPEFHRWRFHPLGAQPLPPELQRSQLRHQERPHHGVSSAVTSREKHFHLPPSPAQQEPGVPNLQVRASAEGQVSSLQVEVPSSLVPFHPRVSRGLGASPNSDPLQEPHRNPPSGPQPPGQSEDSRGYLIIGINS